MPSARSPDRGEVDFSTDRSPARTAPVSPYRARVKRTVIKRLAPRRGIWVTSVGPRDPSALMRFRRFDGAGIGPRTARAPTEPQRIPRVDLHDVVGDLADPARAAAANEACGGIFKRSARRIVGGDKCFRALSGIVDVLGGGDRGRNELSLRPMVAGLWIENQDPPPCFVKAHARLSSETAFASDELVDPGGRQFEEPCLTRRLVVVVAVLCVTCAMTSMPTKSTS